MQKKESVQMQMSDNEGQVSVVTNGGELWFLPIHSSIPPESGEKK